MTTTKREFYFDQDTIKAFMHETFTAKYNFIRSECEWGDEEDFKAVLSDFERQVGEAELKELDDMIENGNKIEVILKYRSALREINILKLEVEQLKKALK